MIYSFKANMAGPYHIDNGIPCQDSYSIEQREDVICVAVADGLGSEAYSDVGSKIAASTATKYCIEHFDNKMPLDKVKAVMNNAFVYAYKAVLQAAADAGNSEDEYDTTLCLAIMKENHVFYGQSGDSGMVALLEDGHYMKVTEQQRDEDGNVFPLCWGPDKWAFGEVTDSVSAIMLMTDGIFEEICPPILRNRDINVNIPLAQKFMERNEEQSDEIAELETAVANYLMKYPRRLLDDDKTMIVVYNTDFPAAKLEDSYYSIPDWNEIYKTVRDKLRNSSRELIDESDGCDESSEVCAEFDEQELCDDECLSETEAMNLPCEECVAIEVVETTDPCKKKRIKT